MKPIYTTILFLLMITSGCIFDGGKSSNPESAGTDAGGSWIVRVYVNDEMPSMLYLAVDQSGDTFTISGGITSDDGVLADSTFSLTYDRMDDAGNPVACTVTGAISGGKITGSFVGNGEMGSWNGTILRPGDTNQGFIFPLTTGNRWEYSGTNVLTNIHGIPAGALPNTSYPSTSQVEIIGTELLQDAVNTIVLQETGTWAGESPGSATSNTWYTLSGDGLYRLAYQGSGSLPLKQANTGNGIPQGNERNSKGTASMFPPHKISQIIDGARYLEEGPVLVLPNPIEVGMQWEQYAAFTGRRVLGRETVQVPAGEFECFKIQRMLDVNHDGIWNEEYVLYDYISPIGLVKRYQAYTGVRNALPEPLAGPDGPIYFYTCDVVTEYVLTSFQVE